MKTFKHLSALLVILTTLAGTAWSQTIELGIFDQYKWDQAKVMADADTVGLDTYPNADTIMICDHTIDYYQPDATYVSWMDMYEKILTEKGKRSKQTLTLPFNETYSTWEVLLIEIIKPDGTVTTIDADSNGKVMIDRSQMSMNIYDPAQKILQIGMPGVEIGDVVHTIIARNNYKPRAKGIWCTLQEFESDSPTRNFVYEIHEPSELPLQRVEIKDQIENTVTSSTREENGRKVYRWEVKNVPQIFEEPAMPASHTVAQRLLVSTAPDWKAVSSWYYKLCEPFLAPSDEMKAKVTELIANCTTDKEKTEAIFKFVSQEIRYLGIIPEGEDEAPGYQPHYVTKTFDNRHGVCRDKAALLASMLRLADLEAFPVLINNGPKMDMEVPLPYFNHAITGILNADGSYTLMDSTDENTKELFPAYLCDKSYLVARPDGETLQVSAIVPATENLMLVNTKGKITSKGDLEAQCHLEFNGINDNAYRSYFARSTPEQRRQFFESVIKSVVAGATLSDCEIKPADMMDTSMPLEADLTFTAEDVLIGQNDTIMVPAISMDRSVGMANFVLRNTGLEKRRFPMQTRYACGVRQTLELELDPAIGQALSIPQYDKIDDEIILQERNFDFKDGKLTGSGTFLIKLTEVSPEQYLVLKDHLRTMEYNDRKMAIFAKPSDEDTAEVVFKNIEHVYKLTDAGNWTETVSVKKQIKTYNGLKENAELKFNFNEGWETIELLSAKVTTGEKVKEITKDEINLMDAGWVASAPRYPASKTLVASLPGVEIGSIIEYKYQRTVTNMPFFAMTELFAAQDPVEHKIVTVQIPEKLSHRIIVDNNGIMEDDNDEKVINETSNTTNGILTYVFEADNLELIPRENNMAPSYSFGPTVLLSTGDWVKYARELKNRLYKASAGQKEAENKAKSIVGKIKSRSDKAIAIRDFVVRNIRKVGPGPGAITNDAITAADTTLADGYGNSTDNAILLYVMCKAAKLKPEFILAGRTYQIESLQKTQLDYSEAYLFGTVLVRVKIDGDYVYLNDSNQYDKLGVTGFDDCPIMDLDNGKITELDVADDLEDRSFRQYDIAVNSDGNANFKICNRIQGNSFGSRKRMFAEMPPEKRDRYVQQLVASVSQSAALTEPLETKYDSYPGIEQFAVTVDKYAVCDGDTIYFEVPNALAVLGLRTDKHETPYYIAGPVESDTTITVKLPEGYSKILMAPPGKVWQLPDNAGTLTSEVSCNDSGIMTITQKVRLNEAVVDPDHYAELMEINRQISHKNMEIILIKKSDSSN